MKKPIHWSHPVFTAKEALAWEQRLLVGGEPAEWSAMVRAGAGVARGIARDARELGGLPAAARLLVLAGKGHNGGDALLAARALLAAHPRATATVLLAGSERALRPLARRAWRELVHAAPQRVEPVTLRALRERLAAEEWWDVVLDGVFGFQFRPPLPPPLAELFAAANEHAAFGLRGAVDLPSGVSDAPAAIAFRADFTYATGIVKAPALTAANAPWVGRLRYVDLDFFAAAEPPLVHEHVIVPEVLAPLRAARPAACDKRTFGHVFIVGGAAGMPGAPLLATLAALRSGVGLVTALVPAPYAAAFAARAPEAMWVGLPETPSGGISLDALGELRGRLDRATALVLGPGLGREAETQAFVAELLKLVAVPTVLDADALQPELLERAGHRAERPLVLTPHAGEFARLRRTAATEVTTPELVGFCTRHRVLTVLKGPITRLGDASGVWHSLAGGPVLARGGSGDVLAGLVGGRLATGANAGTVLERVAQAVAWHGAAADRLARAQGPTSATAGDVLGHLAPALRGTDDGD